MTDVADAAPADTAGCRSPRRAPPKGASAPRAPHDGPARTRNGDHVVLFEKNTQETLAVPLDEKEQISIAGRKWGHAAFIGVPFGAAVAPALQTVYVMRPTPQLITRSIRHRTQIIYEADISLACSLMDLQAGSRVVESGTGSASLTAALAAAVRPAGKVFTFEFHEERWRQAHAEIAARGDDDVVTSFHGDAVEEGFLAKVSKAESAVVAATSQPATSSPSSCAAHTIDAVFLDLPTPWDALTHADAVLRRGVGRLVTFSPCVEQVLRTSERLKDMGYRDVETHELVTKKYGIRRPGRGARMRMWCNETQQFKEIEPHDETFQLPIRGHTSYLTLALAPPAQKQKKTE